MTLSPNLYGLGSMIGWGIQNFLVALVSKKHDTFKIGFLFQVLSFLFTLALLPFIGFGEFKLIPFLSISIVGFCFAIGFTTFIKGFKAGAMSVVTPIAASKSIVTSILSSIFLHEEMYALKVLGICITFVGIIFVSSDFKKIFNEKKMNLIKGAKWAIITAILWGGGLFLLALFSQSFNWYWSNLSLRFWVAFTFVCMLPFANSKITEMFEKRFLKILLVAVICDVIGSISLNIGLVKGDPSILSVISGGSSVIVIICGVTFLKEKLSIMQVLGILSTMVGIVILSIV